MGIAYNSRIVTDNLVLALDAANQKSWGGGGTWKDTTSEGNDGTLTNGPVHSQGPFPGAGYVTFDGTGDYLNTTYTTSNFRWWDTDYTIEAWIYPSSLNTGGWYSGGTPASTLVGNGQVSGGANSWSFGPYNSSGNIKFYYYNGSSQHGMVSTETVNLNEWNHIAFIKNSSGCKIFVNGVGTDYMAISGTPQDNTGHDFFIGRWNSTNITGYVSNLRVVKGTALYTSNFTPPKESLENNSNTTLLTCQGSSISDASDNSLTVTANGDAAAVYNSRPYFSFDSTDDLVTIPNSSDLTFGTGEFAVEIWWNRTTTGTCKAWALGDVYYTTGIELTYSATSGLIVFSGNGGIRITADSVPSSNAWHHYVVERTGSTWKLYIDGVVQSETYSSSASLGTGGDGDMRLGAQKYNGNFYYNGTKNISNFKVYKGKGLTAAEVKQNFNALRGRYGI